MSIQKLKSIFGRSVYLGPKNMLVARDGLAVGGDGKPSVVMSGPDTVAIWDDFIGDTGRSIRAGTDYHWRIVDGDTGTDTGHNANITPGTGGLLALWNGDTPIDGARIGIIGSLNWKGNQGSPPTASKPGLRMAARLKIINEIKDTGNSNINVWLGFTDAVTATGEVPVMDTGGAVVSVASNAFGVGFASSRVTRGAGDTGWVAYAVNGDTNRTPVPIDTGVTLNRYDVIEMELHHGSGDTGGTATFYVNGEAKGSISSPVAMNVALAPTILMWGDTGGGQGVHVDWINVSAPRDTGI